MTSKELIDAAEHTLTLKKCISKKAIVCAEYIIATVREDDDDPVTAKWFALFLGSSDRFEFGSTYCVEMNEVDQWEVWLYGHCLREIKTRGQFRQLCRGLGIPLEEAK